MRKTLPVQLARKKIFTIDEAEEAFNVDRESLRVTLSRLEHQGWLERLENGKYMVIPLTARKGEYTLNEFTIGSELVKPYAISYWSALNHHGLTEQIPGTVFLQTTSRKKRRELQVLGVRYRIVRVAEHKFFGLEKAWIDDTHVNVTDKEKTIIDCLDHPEHCGGVVEAAKALRNGSPDTGRLSEYAKRIRNSGVVRRLGYLSSLLGIQVDLPTIATRSYLYLDPTMPKTGEPNAKWKLIVNAELGELE